MRYFSFVDEKTSDATLSLVYHNMPNDKIKVYPSSDVKVCSVDADDALVAEWLDAQVVEMIEITIAEFQTKRAESEQWLLEWQFLKKQRERELTSSSVVVNSIEYDADETAMDRIDRILTLANWKYNQAVAGGMSPVEAYAAVYKTTITWKGRDNEFHDIQIESLAKAQEAAINKMKTVWEKYE
jgi:hypothetical protein